MSKLPTLYEKGKLQAKGSSPDDIPLVFIQQWLKVRMPEYGTKEATIANRVLVVLAETASGKSTALPVGIFRILHDLKSKTKYVGPGIICTEPKIANAVSLAADISVTTSKFNTDMIIGETVGYQTGPFKLKPVAGICYATIGVLAAQLQILEDSSICELYRFILIDEAHERSTESDMTLMLLRNFYFRNIGNKKLPFLLLLSATFNTEKYARYFNLDDDNIMAVRGRAFGINDFWYDKISSNYPVDAAELAIKIHEENQQDIPTQADILVFMTGIAECKAVIEVFKKYNDMLADRSDGVVRPFLALLLTGDIIKAEASDFAMAFKKISDLPLVNDQKPIRRIIVSTSVAETGLTIYTLKYVIDCGWSRIPEIYYPWGVEGLITKPTPLSRARQRKGRSGRVFEGNYYPLLSKEVYDKLESDQLPAIITEGCVDKFLILISEQIKQKEKLGETNASFRVEDIMLLDPPTVESLQVSNSIAVELGFLIGDKLTELGKIASKFTRTGMEKIRVLMASFMRNVSCSDMLTACAVMSMRMSELIIPQTDQAEIMKLYMPAFVISKTGGTHNDTSSHDTSSADTSSLFGEGETRVEGGSRDGRSHDGVVGKVPLQDNDLFYYRSKLLLNDDFIEMILLFDAYSKIVTKFDGNIELISNWCAENGLNFDGLLSISNYRAQMIEDMVVAGLNPYNNAELSLSNTNMQEFVTRIQSIKQCIFDGMRRMLLRYDSAEACYISRYDLKVKMNSYTEKMIKKMKSAGFPNEVYIPKWCLTDKLSLVVPRSKSDVTPLIYVIEANLISVLDGYVFPDVEFNTPVSSSETTDIKSASIETYEIVCKSALTNAFGESKPIPNHLTDEKLAELYTKNQRDHLIAR
jgi:HrpA-like RNA helicase